MATCPNHFRNGYSDLPAFDLDRLRDNDVVDIQIALVIRRELARYSSFSRPGEFRVGLSADICDPDIRYRPAHNADRGPRSFFSRPPARGVLNQRRHVRKRGVFCCGALDAIGGKDGVIGLPACG
jgi:hypothetical protein